jgi:hypothetical protein
MSQNTPENVTEVASHDLFAKALGVLETATQEFHEAGLRALEAQKSVGAAMRFWRDQNGVSLREIARRMEYSAPYISDLELGRRIWSVKLMESYRAAMESALANAERTRADD